MTCLVRARRKLRRREAGHGALARLIVPEAPCYFHITLLHELILAEEPTGLGLSASLSPSAGNVTQAQRAIVIVRGAVCRLRFQLNKIIPWWHVTYSRMTMRRTGIDREGYRNSLVRNVLRTCDACVDYQFVVQRPAGVVGTRVVLVHFISQLVLAFN